MFQRLPFRSRFALLAIPLLGTLSVQGCAVNPATGERQFSLIGQDREIQMGRDADADVTASLGLVEDEDLQRYVSDIGRRLAATSERPDLPWSFKVVDDPVVNAFALPGGFIYITRGILANFETEAELAGVLGHEIGHVTARHSVTQMSRQQLQQVGLGVGMVLSEDVRRFGDVLAAGLGLLNLRYSRGDETQSDELGVRYMTRAGYDAGELVGVFQMLASASGGEGGRLPEWQLTHPLPENREAHIREIIAASGAPAGGRVARDALLDRVDGLTYGENPREGYFKGSRFLHPDLAFELTYPEGWKTVNQRTVVAAVSPSEEAVVMLELVPDATDPVAALRAFLSQEGVEGGAVRQDDAYGIPSARAPFALETDQSRIRGVATFLRHRDRVFRILGYAGAQRWASHERVVVSAHGTFRPLTDQAVLGVRPWRVEVVTLPRAMTMSEFHERYPSVVPLEEVARLNRHAVDASLAAGARVKRVVGEALP